jgi:GTP:adenosylcobinamide-phosphate guanylyltransferase
MANARFTVIILAAQRNGRLDPLALEAGVTHKCLVPIQGRPLLAHVLAALARVDGIDDIRIAVEAGADDKLRTVAEASGLPVRFTPAADNIADSIYAAAEGVTGPIVVTTADNVLLTPYAVGEVAARLSAGDDIVVALARKEDIQAAHPQAQRNFYEFRDGGFSNCNLYGLSQRGLKGAEAFRSGGQFMKNPMRIAHAFGIFNLLLMRFGWVTTERAMQRIGRRLGVTASRVILADGAHAVDVDNKRTYDIAAELLDRRAA